MPELAPPGGEEPTPEHPLYTAISERPGGDGMMFIVVDEGWRTLILCDRMYPWAAHWLIGQLQGKPLPGESAMTPGVVKHRLRNDKTLAEQLPLAPVPRTALNRGPRAG